MSSRGRPNPNCVQCFIQSITQPHLHEGFNPESGAYSQEDTPSSLQQANITHQLPALHCGAGLWRDTHPADTVVAQTFQSQAFQTASSTERSPCSYKY